MNREVLRSVFEIFDPDHKTTNLAWWKASEDDLGYVARGFMLHVLWATWPHGKHWRNPELITWARRRTLPWLLKHAIRLKAVREAARTELWMLSPVRYQIGLWRTHTPGLKTGYPKLTPRKKRDRHAKLRRKALIPRTNSRGVAWRQRINIGRGRRPVSRVK